MRTTRKSPIVGLIQLLAVVALVWFGVAEGWPWLKERLDRSSGAPASARSGGEGESEALSEAGRCLDRAEAASASLAGVLRSFGRPPYDQAAWGAASLDVAGALGEADSACLCGHPACREAAAAVSTLRQELAMADGMVRGESGGNLAVLRERADEHLDRARDLLR
jgi:hypothetical protein